MQSQSGSVEVLLIALRAHPQRLPSKHLRCCRCSNLAHLRCPQLWECSFADFARSVFAGCHCPLLLASLRHAIDIAGETVDVLQQLRVTCPRCFLEVVFNAKVKWIHPGPEKTNPSTFRAPMHSRSGPPWIFSGLEWNCIFRDPNGYWIHFSGPEWIHFSRTEWDCIFFKDNPYMNAMARGTFWICSSFQGACPQTGGPNATNFPVNLSNRHKKVF